VQGIRNIKSLSSPSLISYKDLQRIEMNLPNDDQLIQDYLQKDVRYY
jgi:hypothetical protein